MRVLSVFMLLLVFAGMGLFAQHNGQTTDVSFLYWSWTDVPIWAPAAASSLIVFFVGCVYVAASGVTWRWRYRRLKRAAEGLDARWVPADAPARPPSLPKDPRVGDFIGQTPTSSLVEVPSQAPASPASVPTDPWARDLREGSE